MDATGGQKHPSEAKNGMKESFYSATATAKKPSEAKNGMKESIYGKKCFMKVA